MEYDPVYEANKHSFDLKFSHHLDTDPEIPLAFRERPSRRFWRNVITIVIFILVMKYL